MKLNSLFDIFDDESGATAIEYGLIAALVAVGLVGSLTALRTNLDEIFGSIGTALDNAGAPAAK